jgi:hypothetical protein
MRDVMRELPQLIATKERVLDPKEFMEVIKSSYAKKADLKVTEQRKRQMVRFQNSYMGLIHTIEKDFTSSRNQLLLELTMRSSVINKFDRVTGDSITYIVEKVQKLRPKLTAEELYFLARQFKSYQNLDPDDKHVSSSETLSRHKNIMQGLYSIVRECREGI